MKVVWFTNIVLPEFADRIGLARINQGGWLPSLVDAIRKYAPQMELHICSAGPEGRQETINGVFYHALGSAYDGFFLHRPSRKFARNVSDLIRRIQPDLIHFHGSEGLFGTVPREAYAGTKSVVSLQGILQGCHPHYAGGINELEIRRYRNYLNVLLTRYTVTRGAESWRVRMGEREALALSFASNIIGRTNWDFAWTRYLAPSAQYFHVDEVLRPEFYKGVRDVKQVKRHTIFCGGAMAYPLKGGHWLLRAVSSLIHRYPDIELRVANADRVKPHGTITDWVSRNEYRRYLWKIIKDNDLEKHVVLLPSLDADGIAEELCRAEIFCLPSMCENSPNSLGESMMLGVPAIATDVGGVSSILANGKEGVLVPSGDPAAIAAAISGYFDNPQKGKLLASEAYKTAMRRHNPEIVVAQLTKAYEKITEG